jgi:FkbM family methyltransferase
VRSLIKKIRPLARVLRTVRDEWQWRTNEVVATPYGFRLAAADTSILNGSFEVQERKALAKYLEKADVFVDIGANIGLYTCIARSMNKYVLAFEPLPQNLRWLYRNLEENGWLDVEVYPMGLGCKPGLASLYGAGTGASLVNGWSGGVDDRYQVIALNCLDNLLGRRFEGQQLLIKIDVEGAELDVLHGARETLGTRRPRPIWFMEVCLTHHHPGGRNPHFLETFDYFWTDGYEARTADPSSRLISRDEVIGWIRSACPETGYNWIFLPRGETTGHKGS